MIGTTSQHHLNSTNKIFGGSRNSWRRTKNYSCTDIRGKPLSPERLEKFQRLKRLDEDCCRKKPSSREFPYWNTNKQLVTDSNIQQFIDQYLQCLRNNKIVQEKILQAGKKVEVYFIALQKEVQEILNHISLDQDEFNLNYFVSAIIEADRYLAIRSGLIKRGIITQAVIAKVFQISLSTIHYKYLKIIRSVTTTQLEKLSVKDFTKLILQKFIKSEKVQKHVNKIKISLESFLRELQDAVQAILNCISLELRKQWGDCNKYLLACAVVAGAITLMGANRGKKTGIIRQAVIADILNVDQFSLFQYYYRFKIKPAVFTLFTEARLKANRKQVFYKLVTHGRINKPKKPIGRYFYGN